MRFLWIYLEFQIVLRRKKLIFFEKNNKSTIILCLQVPWKSIWSLYYFTNVVEIYALACRGAFTAVAIIWLQMPSMHTLFKKSLQKHCQMVLSRFLGCSKFTRFFYGGQSHHWYIVSDAMFRESSYCLTTLHKVWDVMQCIVLFLLGLGTAFNHWSWYCRSDT
jgi:hypothetical protein